MVMLYGTDGNSNMIELEDDFCFQNDPNPIYYVTTKWLGDIEGWDPHCIGHHMKKSSFTYFLWQNLYHPVVGSLKHGVTHILKAFECWIPAVRNANICN